MSKVKLFSLAVSFLLLVGGAARADVLVFPDIEATEKALRHNGWMTDEGIVSRLLAQVACQSNVGKSVMSKYPKLYQSDGACVDLFLARNSIKSTMITPEEYQAKAKGGWWLPTNSDVASNGAEVQDLTKQLAATQQRVGVLEGDQDKLQAFQGQVATLSKKADAASAMSARAKAAAEAARAELQTFRNEGLTSQMVKQVDGRVSSQLVGVAKKVDDTSQLVSNLDKKVNTLSGEVLKVKGGRGTAIYLATLALALGLVLVIWQLLRSNTLRKKFNGIDVGLTKQGKRTAELEQAVFGLIEDEKSGLVWSVSGLVKRQEEVDDELAKQKADLEGLKGELKTTLYGQSRINKQVRTLRSEVDDLQSVSEAVAPVEFDSANPGLEALDQLPVGEEFGVTWKGRYDNGHFTVKIWKDETTLLGMVKTNVVRSTDSGQLAEPMSLKRLKKRIEAAVVDGRVPVVKLLSNQAAAA